MNEHEKTPDSADSKTEPDSATGKEPEARKELPASTRQASGAAPPGYRWGDEFCR